MTEREREREHRIKFIVVQSLFIEYILLVLVNNIHIIHHWFLPRELLLEDMDISSTITLNM